MLDTQNDRIKEILSKLEDEPEEVESEKKARDKKGKTEFYQVNMYFKIIFFLSSVSNSIHENLMSY